MNAHSVNPKTIQLFLMDGTASGRLKATLSNWTGVTYLLPRTTIQASRDREDLNQTGVYLLFGIDEQSGNQQVYVGQARERKNGRGVLGRIIEHIGEEKLEYWTHAIALITSNNSFGPTEISYLENKFTGMAREAGRYIVTNGNDPSTSTVTEEKQAELDEFIEYARLVVGALGYRVFEPIDDAKANIEPVPEEPTLYLVTGYSRALGRQTSDGFVVLAGSKLRPQEQFAPSVPESAIKYRQKYAEFITPEFELEKDIRFDSPSGAAAFVEGVSINGREKWKNEQGLSLAQLEAIEIRQTS